MNHSLWNLNFEQLEIFFIVVEQSSFTKAGLKLNMTQSAISKSIAKLEKDIDIQLFTRVHRNLYITEAGQELYTRWKKKVKDIVDIYEEIWRLQHEHNNGLIVGVANTTNLDLYFWPLINEFHRRFPEVHLEMDSDSIKQLVEKLENNQADLIFIPDFMHYSIEQGGMEWKWVAKDAAQVILPREHLLAQKKLTLDIIKDEFFVFLGEDIIPDYTKYYKDKFAQKGYEIKLGKVYNTPESVARFYKSEDGIMLTDAYFDYGGYQEKVVRKPLEEFESGIICAWKPDTKIPYISNLLRLLKIE